MIKKAKPYWAAFNASSYIKELTVGNIWLVHGYSNDIFQANLDAQAAGRKFRILQGMPKEGAVLAVDNMVIDKSAPRADLALKFMNFMLDGQELRRAHQPDRLRQSEHRRRQVHQARAPEEPGDLPGQGRPGEARAAAGPDRRAAPAAQQAVDRDQGRALIARRPVRDVGERVTGPEPRAPRGRPNEPPRPSARRAIALAAPALPGGALRARDRLREPAAVRALDGARCRAPPTSCSAPWPPRWVRYDIISNVVAYLPFGFFVAAGAAPAAARPEAGGGDRRRHAAVVRDGNAADVPADARRQRRGPARQCRRERRWAAGWPWR